MTRLGGFNQRISTLPGFHQTVQDLVHRCGCQDLCLHCVGAVVALPVADHLARIPGVTHPQLTGSKANEKVINSKQKSKQKSKQISKQATYIEGQQKQTKHTTIKSITK